MDNNDDGDDDDDDDVDVDDADYNGDDAVVVFISYHGAFVTLHRTMRLRFITH